MLDTVSSVEEPSTKGVIPRSWWEAAISIAQEREEIEGDVDGASGSIPILDIFWRTLVADRDDRGHPPPSWYRRACEESYRRIDSGEEE